jgi:histone-lysine N-methyltransferase SUV39H
MNRSSKSAPAAVKNTFKKRKSPDTESELECRPSPIDRQLGLIYRTPAASRASSVASGSSASSGPPLSSVDIYNGVIDDQDSYVFARAVNVHKHMIGPDIAQIIVNPLPADMIRTAKRSKVNQAETLIRAEYTRRLESVPGRRIYLVNIIDRTTPSLRFRYIPDYVLREGVYKADLDTQVGCKQCSPHMGRDIGCEYTKRCDCLEYAAVDESRLDDEQRKKFQIAKQTGGSTIGLSKKFPYFASSDKIGCLVPFYLHSRRPIYECNDNCNCGPHCRNKNVQFGRTVELEIFKTASGRGWGLRCKQDLQEGQFIDTYRGEVVTDAEATRREQASQSKSKASYMYSLDKFAESEGLSESDVYVVDGEFMGGPTKFMNHSCEPNCRQYTVSYNKHDCRIYDLAFFACQYIPVGTELTFDYLDKEEGGDEVLEPNEDAVPCLCGAAKCRKWLWI